MQLTKEQLLSLLRELYESVHEDFPGKALEQLSVADLECEVRSLRAYACAADLDADNC